jgi:hypothetical protein
MKTLSTEIDIDAAPDTVWAVLMDFAAYPEWNPFVVSLAGERRLGARLEASLQPAGGKAMRFRPVVTAFEDGRFFEWLGRLGIKGLFDGRHQYRIEPSGDRTKFIQSEQFTGILVPLLSRSLNGGTRAGFEAMNRALKERAEGTTLGRD